MKRGRKYFRNLKNSNEMVSDLVGTFALLAIAVVIFSSLYGIVFSYPLNTDPAKVTIIGTIEGDTIILEHRGGEALGPETTIPITIAGEKKLIDGRTPIVRDLLIENNGSRDGLWNIGERLVYEVNYSEFFYKHNSNINNLEAELIAIDVKGNHIVLTGTLDIHPESDIGVKITVDPVIDYNTTLRVKATNYRGDMNASNITIKCKLPIGMNYSSHDLSKGEYDDITGFWYIKELDITQSATLNINVTLLREIKVKSTGGGDTEYTQLALLIDGSESISSSNWSVMLNGIAAAITNGYIPHNGQVELTIIQFGGWTGGAPGQNGGRSWAQVELDGPIVIDNTNYNTVATNIQGISQLKGGTAMSCAFRLVADVLSGDPNDYLNGTDFEGMASTHSDWPRQVVNLITDGQPNIIYIHEERYAGWWPGEVPNEFILGKADTELALTYYESLIPIEDSDEIDSEAVGTLNDIPWLREEVVRPGHFDKWPPTGPGWVRYVDNFIELANALKEKFELLFFQTISIAEIVASTPIDPNPANNQASITITS